MSELTYEEAMRLIKLINLTVRNNYLNDQGAMEEIVGIFEAYGIDCGNRSEKHEPFYVLRD